MNELHSGSMHTAAPSEPEPTPGLRMSTHVPHIVSELKAAGVALVMAGYDSRDRNSLMAIAFIGDNDQPIPPPLKPDAANELAQLFIALLRRRCPDCRERLSGSGIFQWDVREDTLEHQHDRVVKATFYGLE